MGKKIIFTVTNDLTYDQRMQKICRSMCAAGYAVALVGRELGTSKPLTAEPFEQKRLSCFFNKGKLFYIEYNIRLFIYLLFAKYDALCAIDLDTIVPVYHAGKLRGVKLAYDAHEYFTEVPEVIRRPKVQRVWQWVERNYVPKFDVIYTVSPTLAKLFAEHYNKEVGVVMNVPPLKDGGPMTDDGGKASLKLITPKRKFEWFNGLIIFALYLLLVNLVLGSRVFEVQMHDTYLMLEYRLVFILLGFSVFLFSIIYKAVASKKTSVDVLKRQDESSVTRHPSPVPFLLYQGALNESRGLEHLIQSMQYIDAKLLLAGEGDLSSELRALVKQLNLENKVEFLGYVKPADLRAVTAQAYIGINLLENKGLSYYYSLSNKFFDYIHAHVPQVCIGFPEYVALNDKYNVAVLTQNCSIEEIKGAILRLLSDKDLYCTLQKKCEVCSRELNWQQEEKKLWALYEQLFR